ncbi:MULTISPECIES: ADP-glyceromanno-heptose 6-epimerase [unclassified Methylophilus]|jgi:ADP-L-glycero-D-manno-heptose 6-epimerase|uniref:ADP-glyceromanno-heptose 6-epimerase n=1 Tax=unclassified Methylophilus TaxID=2630143 RepID=UPI0006F90A4A|nr:MULTISPECIES: ADP-glyceromanno-heptose 6-epimerase [unclassified Methylophilus]KQT34111.1 ADP-L-glycero-D-mannoheptose-6-epimerase [Methylophilus sp. Leaf414]KQT41656.1 ADP-L-glycero-D-mannoheptose-6-epimerase [Methylophilus sp. Leaf416]KQT55823.1 ADP-L-glycero-D-mannoheptose-6-epimerase [Methylophilus sp. Leaf459]
MIIITGGAGMIGSIMAWHLNNKLGRQDLVIVDRITHENQWQNLVHRHYAEYLDKDQLFDFLEDNDDITAVIHMGAISATTERDFNKLVADNMHYSQDLWSWCAEYEVPFFYASSAATYGGGEQGYDDASIENLRPLNGYGYSKHFFDQWVLQQVAQKQITPPAWAGFKFFNVYGPNEYHKERMASVAYHTFNQFSETGTMRLFKGTKEGIEDGMQLRDFVYVKDVADVMGFFLEAALKQKPATSAIYNIGTGQARSFKDLATNVMTSMAREPHITYIDMPQDLQGKYQYFTQAEMQKLRHAGYKKPFTSLEEGVKDYVQQYLMQDDPYC